MANRQLRSEVLKRALKACIVQPVIRKYQVVAVRAMWGSDVDAREVIWGKRMQMENILLSNEQVSCFFSCITYMARPRKRKSMRNEGEEEEGADSSSEGDNRNGANAPETFPGISFWIACDLPNCTLSQFETNLSKSFMQAWLNLTTCNAIQTRGKTSALQAFSGSLYQVLKDHNREEAKRIVEISHRTMIRSAARDEGVQLDHVAVMESEQYSMKPCQLILTKNIDKEVYQDVIRGLSEIRFTSLDLKVIDKSEGTEVTIPVKPTNKLCQSVDIVRRMMERNSFGLCNGGVYKKIGESRYTYVYCCSVKSYLYRSLKNKAIANEITPNLRELVFLLSDGECQIIDQITLDYNYIECLPNGVCYNIAKKCFDVKPNLKGSPRAFVRYFHREGKNPEPKPFIEGVENSFPDRNVRLRFYQKWYQILLAGQYPMKEKKLLLVGPPDSGKTSWFAPFQGIIPEMYIAGVVRDGRFSGHLINRNTQVVFMDEWTSDSLCCEDAKRILQGGLVMIPQKHKEPARFQYNSGFFITTNIMPDFGNGVDGEAILRRLEVFETKTLRVKDNSITKWMRMHCMEIFVYVASQLKDISLFTSETNVAKKNQVGAVYNDVDCDPSVFLDEEQTLEASSSGLSTRVQIENAVPQEAIDYAIIAADDRDGILYHALNFDHELFDIENKLHSAEYMRKMYEIAAGAWEEICPLINNDETLVAFKRRKRINWQGSDTFYDTWLLATNSCRDCFPTKEMKELYPDWAQLIEQDEDEGEGSSHDREENEEEEEETNEEEEGHREEEETEEHEINAQSTKPVSTVKQEYMPFCPANNSTAFIDLVSDDESVPEISSVKLELFSADNSTTSLDCDVICISSDEEDN